MFYGSLVLEVARPTNKLVTYRYVLERLKSSQKGYNMKLLSRILIQHHAQPTPQTM